MSPKDQAEKVMMKLRKAGFTVVIDTMPPRPWLFTPSGVLLHHTASTSTTSVKFEENDVQVLKTDSGVAWPAPKVQWYVGRTGRIYLIAKGGANHAGTGELTQAGIPPNEGNRYLWGIEAQSAGLRQDWTDEEWESVTALTAELCMAMGVDQDRVWRHKDYDDDSGKIDTQYSLAAHRQAVREYIEEENVDYEKIQQIVDKSIKDATPAIAEEAAKVLLDSDLYPKAATLHLTVRDSLKGKELP